jgi:hypothetical protein
MFTETTSFRPRNGLSAECYWRVRKWCSENGFAVSDVFNSVIIPLSYYLESHCLVEPEKSMATVELNVGKLPILHVFGGKCYPLLEHKNDRVKRAYTLDELQERIDYWARRNAEEPEVYDQILKESDG